jgi:hypothetical protein
VVPLGKAILGKDMADNDCQRCHSLKAVCDEAFAKYPHSCSHSVWHVIKKYNPQQPYLMANTLIHSMITDPRWQEIQVYYLSRLASEGALIVGGMIGESHGHVIIVYPAVQKASGGYHYTNRKNGKLEEARTLGVYPLAMSTSKGLGLEPAAKVTRQLSILAQYL